MDSRKRTRTLIKWNERQTFISDFLLSKHQSKIFVEIIGFWTREYRERKLQKILQII